MIGGVSVEASVVWVWDHLEGSRLPQNKYRNV